MPRDIKYIKTFITKTAVVAFKQYLLYTLGLRELAVRTMGFSQRKSSVRERCLVPASFLNVPLAIIEGMQIWSCSVHIVPWVHIHMLDIGHNNCDAELIKQKNMLVDCVNLPEMKTWVNTLSAGSLYVADMTIDTANLKNAKYVITYGTRLRSEIFAHALLAYLFRNTNVIFKLYIALLCWETSAYVFRQSDPKAISCRNPLL